MEISHYKDRVTMRNKKKKKQKKVCPFPVEDRKNASTIQKAKTSQINSLFILILTLPSETYTLHFFFKFKYCN